MRLSFTLLLLLLFIKVFAGDGEGKDVYAYSPRTLKEGVYLSYEDFKNNSPSVPIEAVKITKPDSNAYHLTMSSFLVKGKKVKQFKNIWGVCINGVPYINYRGKKGETTFRVNSHSGIGKPNKYHPVTFYRMDVHGNVCVFALEHVLRAGMPKSYSRYTIPKSVQYIRLKALDINTGKISDLTPDYVWNIVKDDAFVLDLLKSGVTNMSLVQFIELYNERNPRYPVAQIEQP